MEELKILNPDTQTILGVEELKNLSPELQAIISLSLSLHNRAVEGVAAGNHESAWLHISDAVSLFPYADIPLQFAFLLALELGKYQHAKKILHYLDPFLGENDQKRLATQLDQDLSIYNSLVSGSDEIQHHATQRLIHRILISLQENGAGIPSSDQVIKTGEILPQRTAKSGVYKYMTLLSIPLLVTAVVLFFYSNVAKNNAVSTVRSMEIQIASRDSTLQAEQNLLSSQRILTRFYRAYHQHSYLKCAQLLSNNTALVDTILDIDLSILEQVCAQLYKADRYQLVVDIPFESTYHLHSYFQLILSASGEFRRSQKIAFVRRYPHSHIYTPPLLRELYDTEVNDDSKIKYASKLYELVNDTSNQDLQFLLTNKMISELEQSRGLPASKQ